MEIATVLEEIHRQAHRSWAQMLQDHDFGYAEFEYLVAIKKQEANDAGQKSHGQHLQDIVLDIGVSKASASAMVQKLEARGLVKRLQCRYDARAQHILLTQSGAKRLAAGQDIYAKLTHSLDVQIAQLRAQSEIAER